MTSPSLPVSQSPSRSLEATVGLLVLLFLAATNATAQLLSDLEPERPIRIEDARPVSYRAFSGAVDWTYNVRQAHLNDHGPGFSLVYGAARSLELGGSVRYVTRPGRNALRGVSSGDIVLHALYGLTTESAGWPALALRAGVEFPTGLDSKGTDLQVAGLVTRTIGSLRLHGNLHWTRLGATTGTERHDRVEGVLGIDLLPKPRGLTDTLLLADLAYRTNPVRDGTAIVAVELGARQRIGPQTLFFVGAGSELTGEADRARLRLRAGISHVF